MWAFILAWALLTLTAALAYMVLTQQIVDEIEQDLPLDQRPSFRLFKLKLGLPLKELKIHSTMYPNSSVRARWKVATTCFYMLILIGLLWVWIWNLRHP